MGKRAKKYKGYENPEAHRANVARTLSGAAGSHDSRPKRERTRDAVKRAEIQRESE